MDRHHHQINWASSSTSHLRTLTIYSILTIQQDIMDIDQSLDDRIAAARKTDRPSQRGRSNSDRRNVVGGGVGRRGGGGGGGSGRDSPNNSGRNTPVNMRPSPILSVSFPSVIFAAVSREGCNPPGYRMVQPCFRCRAFADEASSSLHVFCLFSFTFSVLHLAQLTKHGHTIFTPQTTTARIVVVEAASSC